MSYSGLLVAGNDREMTRVQTAGVVKVRIQVATKGTLSPVPLNGSLMTGMTLSIRYAEVRLLGGGCDISSVRFQHTHIERKSGAFTNTAGDVLSTCFS